MRAKVTKLSPDGTPMRFAIEIDGNQFTIVGDINEKVHDTKELLSDKVVSFEPYSYENELKAELIELRHRVALIESGVHKR